MPTRYFLIPVKVTKFTASNNKMEFKETTIANPPIHTVVWTNEDDVSRTYTVKIDDSPYPGPPKVGDQIKLALSEAYCANQSIDTTGRVKKPAELDANTPLAGEWYGLKVKAASLTLELSTGKKIDLLNAPLALAESVFVDGDGNVNVLLTPTGRGLLGIPGLMQFVGSLNSFRAPIGGGSSKADRERLKALLLSVAAILD